MTAPFVTLSMDAQIFGVTGRSPLIHWLTMEGVTPKAAANADWLPTMTQASITAVCVAVLISIM
ncbi:hypothetical protein D3C85_1530360 [compost metagenome]